MTKQLFSSTLEPAYEGSFYSIAGVGGDINEWIDGYNGLLADAGIGTPTAWYQTTGESVNTFAGVEVDERDQFNPELTLLLFPLDGLDVGKLAMFKLRMQDRWFDDVINNMRTL